MAKTIVNTTDTLASWKEKTNAISIDVGDITQLTTVEDSDVVGAINSLKTEVGSASSLTTSTQSSTVAAINELDGQVGDLASLATISRSSLVSAINELETNHNSIDSDLGGNGGANDPRAAINVRGTSQNGFRYKQSFAAALNELADSMGRGSLGMSASNVKAALREHEADLGNMTFTGLSATNVSAAVRELRTELGDHSALDTTTTTSAVAAINELVDRVDSVDALVDQSVKTTSNVLFPQTTLGTAGGADNSVYNKAGVTRTGDYTVDVSGNIVLDADLASWTFKDNGTTRYSFSGTNDKTLATGSTGNFILDVAGNIELNADGATWTLKDAATTRWEFSGTTNKTLSTGTTGNFLLDVAGSVSLDTYSGIWNLSKDHTNIINISATTDVDILLPNTNNLNLTVKENIYFNTQDGNTVQFQESGGGTVSFVLDSTGQELDVPVGDFTIDAAGDVTLDVGRRSNNTPGFINFMDSGVSGISMRADGLRIYSPFWHNQTEDDFYNISAAGRHYFGNSDDAMALTIDLKPSSVATNGYMIQAAGGVDFTLRADADINLIPADGNVRLKTELNGVMYGNIKEGAGLNNLTLATGRHDRDALSFVDLGSNLRGAKATFTGPVFLDSALTSDITGKSVAGALNQLDLELDLVQALAGGGGLGSTSWTGLSSTNLKTAIQEIATELYSSGTSFTGLSATNFKSAVNELRTELGDVNAIDADLSATNAIAAINEVYTYAEGVAADVASIEGNLGDSIGTGGLDTKAQNLIGAINELNDSIGSGGLDTTAQTLIGAINELEGRTTSAIAEGTNQYFTTSRARQALGTPVNSGTGYGSISYNSATGVYTYNKVTNTNIRSAFSEGTGINISSGVISGEYASDTNAGIASFNANSFVITDQGRVSLKTNSVSSAYITDAAVSYTKLQRATTANRVLAAATDGGEFRETLVTGAMLDNRAITLGKIQNMVSANRLLGGTQAGQQVQEVQVNTAMIEDGAITGAKLANTTTLIIKNVSGVEITRVVGIGA